MSAPFVYEQVYEFLSDEEKLGWLQRELDDELGPRWNAVKDNPFTEEYNEVSEAIFDNYASQGAILKRIEEKAAQNPLT